MNQAARARPPSSPFLHGSIASRVFVLATVLACAMAGCGGGADVTASPAQSQSDNTDVSTASAPSVTLAAPQAIEGSDRIRLSWSAPSKALTFSVLLQRSDQHGFEPVASGLNGTTTALDRGPAWKLDFPTARVKVRACHRRSHKCADSNAQPLLDALVKGVVELHSVRPTSADAFANSVSLSRDGNTLAVSVELDNGAILPAPNPPPPYGSFYVFRRDANGAWQQAAYIRNPGQGANFGARVVLSGDGGTVAVSAPSFNGVGAVYVYRRDSQGQWQQQAVVTDAGLAADAFFGFMTALSDRGDVLVAGTTVATAYVFVRDAAGTWTREFVVKNDLASRDQIDPTVFTLSGNGKVLVFGGTRAEAATCDFFACFRAAFVLRHRGSQGWAREATLPSPNVLGPDDDAFAGSLALDADGNTLVVGAAGEDSSAIDSGALHVYRHNAGAGWRREAFIKARGAAAGDAFGTKVSVSGDGRVLLGTALGAAANVPGVNRMNPVSATPQALGGAAYVFERHPGGIWTERATVVPPVVDGLPFQLAWGNPAALSGDGSTLVLGAFAPTATGSIYERAFVY